MVKVTAHRVTKCITSRRGSRAGPSRCGCVVAQRDGPARLSRRLVEGDRVVVVSYALYRVPSLYCLASDGLNLSRIVRLILSSMIKCARGYTPFHTWSSCNNKYVRLLYKTINIVNFILISILASGKHVRVSL